MLKFILPLALVSFFAFSLPAIADDSTEQQLVAAQAELDAASKESEALAKEYEVIAAKSTAAMQEMAAKYANAGTMKPEEIDALAKEQSAMGVQAGAEAQAFAVKQAAQNAKIMTLSAKVMELSQKLQAEQAKQ